ncbi:MAG: zf-TFIIB domain-containing protein [Candidatus Omnitrophica bacterium]|nr:zf-TFIIB domain-containing protein [Candidatus Omnitrophota bacterium]
MDCPKCIGRLKALRIKRYGLEKMYTRSRRGGSPGPEVMITTVIKAPKKAGVLELDKCWVCNGIWFDKGELKKLQREKLDRKTIGSHIDDPKLYKLLNKKGGLCPRCKAPMRKMKGKTGARNITVDICITCGGIWLDGGEVNYFLRGRREKWFQSIETLFYSNWFRFRR